jgi:hypothetical protein
VEPGDSFVLAPHTTGQIRNDSDEPAVFAVASIRAAEAAATPAA